MDRVLLLGNSFPRGFKINATNPVIDFRSTDGTIHAQIILQINQSRIAIEWTLEKFDHSMMNVILKQSDLLATTIVGLIGFRMGNGATVAIDRYQINDNPVQELSIFDLAVQNIATSMANSEDCTKVMEVAFKHPYIGTIVSDITASLYRPTNRLINCGRAIEGIRHILSSDTMDIKLQWQNLRDVLNVDREYIHLVVSNSIQPRHGKPIDVPEDVEGEILKRTWTIVDRYLHYAKRGNIALPEADFPLLKG